MTQWNVHDSFSEFGSKIIKCETLPSRNGLYSQFKGNDLISRVTKTHVYVWKTIMNNYSYEYSRNTYYCVNGKIYHKSEDIDTYTIRLRHEITDKIGFHRVSLSFSNEISSFQFITCENRGMSEYPFEKLVVAYQPSVWGSFFASYVCIVIVFHLKYSEFGFHKYFTVIKLVLDQGDPFPMHFSKTKSGKLVLGILCLASLVLSNANTKTTMCIEC